MGFVIRVITGFAFDALSVAAGWSGIVTLVVMYLSAAVVPVRITDRPARLGLIALGRAGPSEERSPPAATRMAVRVALVAAAVPIAVAVVTMPASGPVVDDVTGGLVAAMILLAYVWFVFPRVLARRGSRRTRRREAR